VEMSRPYSTRGRDEKYVKHLVVEPEGMRPFGIILNFILKTNI
jgi:hypothetical protein